MRIRQVVTLARQTPVHAFGNLGNGAIFTLVFWHRLSHGAIALWFGLFVLFSGAQLVSWWRKRDWPIPVRVSRRGVLNTAIWSLVAGVLWSVAVIGAFPNADAARQVLIAFLVGGLSAGAVASMAMNPIACVAFFLPSAVSVALMLMAQGGGVDEAMAGMMTVYIVVLLVALMNGFASYVEMIRTKMENRSLASGLAQSLETNRAKSQFLASMSHELRTPLNAIIGFSQLIRDEMFGPVGTPDYRTYAADIYGSGQHLLRIIGDVLDMSKLETDRVELHADAIDIAGLIADTMDFIHGRAAEKGVTLAIELPSGLPKLNADGIRVKQILLNLLSNAVKFNKDGGQVRISANVDADGLSLHVTDTGIGMSESQIATAMEPFSHIDDAFVRKYGGVGLGLSLAQGLIRLHGGRLKLSSVPGAGTIATAIFPPERLVLPAASQASTIAA